MNNELEKQISISLFHFCGPLLFSTPLLLLTSPLPQLRLSFSPSKRLQKLPDISLSSIAVIFLIFKLINKRIFVEIKFVIISSVFTCH